MKNLYNKIYNAVNEGIQKALLIDSEQNDVSINYSYHKIDNNAKLMNLYVNELIHSNGTILNQEVLDILNNINDYYKVEKKQYIVKDFNELSEIWKKLYKYAVFYAAAKKEETRQSIFNLLWSWIDTSNALALILDNDTEISFSHYKGEKVKFVVIKQNNSCGDILIHSKGYISDEPLKWEKGKKQNFMYKDTVSSDDSYTDYDGWIHTYRNSNIFDGKKNNFKSYPALNYVNSLKNIEPGYEAYLPAYGQLRIILSDYKYDLIIDHVFNVINHNDFIDIGKLQVNFWSSTEWTNEQAFAYVFNNGNNAAYQEKFKNTLNFVFPIFKKI